MVSCVTECFFGNLKTETGDLWRFGELAGKTEQYITYYDRKRSG